MSGPIQLGVIPTLGPYLLPHLVPHLRADYPRLRLYLREALTAMLVERLRTGMLDAILVALPIHADGLEIIELFREPFMLALPTGDPLAQKTAVVEADLADASLLLLEDGHCLRDRALAVCGFPAHGSEDFRASSLETLRQMVAAGMGCTLLPALAARSVSPTEALIELRPFANPAPSRVIGLALRRGFPRMDMGLAFAAFIRRYAPAGVTVIPAPEARVEPKASAAPVAKSARTQAVRRKP
jgi:LysR family hydrogen peroxide-inducible transcriptional activator